MAMRLHSLTPALAVAAPCPDHSPIAKLHDDVLMHIFTLGVELYKWHPDGLTQHASWLLEHGQEWKANNVPFCTLFQQTVSQVCSDWRRVALNTASLWTTLNFSDAGPSARSLLYITRSKNAPLDISITFGPRTDTAQWNQAQLIENRGENLDLIMATLLPHLSRWRMFFFWAHDPTYLNDLVSKLAYADAAPRLEVLMLNAYTPPYSDDRNAPDEPSDSAAHACDNHRLFAGEMPKLRVLSISRAIFSWELSDLLESNLTSLTIAQCGQDIGYHLPSGDLICLLQNSHDLRNLTLEWFQDMQEESWEDVSVVLPALTHLSVAFLDHTDIVTFLAHVALPNLRSLALLGNTTRHVFSHNAYDLIKALSKITILEGITHLKLSRVSLYLQGPKAARTAVKFCRKLKSVETLDVTWDTAADDGFLKAWKLPRTFPRVNTLVLRGCSGKLVRRLVETNHGRPLARVFLADQAWKKVTADLITLRAKEEDWGGPDVEYIDLNPKLEATFDSDVDSECDYEEY